MANPLERSLVSVMEKLPLRFYSLSGRQVSLRELLPSARKDEHLEFDGVGLSGRTCILVEITDQKRDNRKKIRRFVRHANLFQSSEVNLKDRFRIFPTIPRQHLRHFEDVNEWRYLYIGTSPELRADKIRQSSFTEAQSPLTILWDEEWSYLRLLTKNIGKYAGGELFAALNLHPGHEEGGSPSRLERPYIELERRRLGHNLPKADVFVTDFSAHELLTMSRVLRYQRLPITVESNTGDVESTGYQRLLNREKLRSIRDYIGDDQLVAFPNAITVVASACKKENVDGRPRLIIPNRYASLDLIDGQHRLFSYADDSVKNAVKKRARLLTTVISFDQADSSLVQQYAATLFVTINQTQARVKTELIYLTAYDAMGDDSGHAIAGKVLSECNDRTNSPLFGLLRVRPLIQRPRGSVKPIPIVTIVNALSPLLDRNKVDNFPTKQKQRLFKIVRTDDQKFRRRDERKRVGNELLTQFFNRVKNAFQHDYRSEHSNLMCAKYFAALIGLMRQLILEEGKDWTSIGSVLKRLDTRARTRSGTDLAFPTGSASVPTKKASVEEILQYLENCRS